MINILFIGSFPPDFLIKRSKGTIDSLYRDDQALISGLRGRSDVNLNVITSPDIASWPHGPFFIKRETNGSEELTMVSSLNLPFLKQLWTIFSMFRESRSIVSKLKGPVVVMIPYVVFRHAFTLRILRILFREKVIQACVVPDIFFPTKWSLRIMNHAAERMASKFDAFLLYTEKMAEHLNIEKGRYEVIEGFRIIPDRIPAQSADFKVVYAGSLNLIYGVGRLIEAMTLIEENDIQLHLYGAGTAEVMIKDACQKDKRIVFHGRVPNSEATDAIYSASVLINPRNATDGEYTEYSFPSKDIEYMATGIPTLLCKLPGMPSEYYGHFVDIGDGTPSQIAAGMLKVKRMTTEERATIGNDARTFVSERMDCNKQAERIVKMLNKIISEK